MKKETKSGVYSTRKEQIDDDFQRVLVKKLKASGCFIESKQRALIAEALRDAAMVGACEERDHCLKILRANGLHNAAKDISSWSIMEVLGYEVT